MNIRRHLRVVVNPCDIWISRRIDPFITDDRYLQRPSHLGYRLMQLRGKRMGSIHNQPYTVRFNKGFHRLPVHRTINTLAVMQCQLLFTSLRTIIEW